MVVFVAVVLFGGDWRGCCLVLRLFAVVCCCSLLLVADCYCLGLFDVWDLVCRFFNVFVFMFLSFV